MHVEIVKNKEKFSSKKIWVYPISQSVCLQIYRIAFISY